MNASPQSLPKLEDCRPRFNFRAHQTAPAGPRARAAAGQFSLRRVKSGALLKIWHKFLRDL